MKNPRSTEAEEPIGCFDSVVGWWRIASLMVPLLLGGTGLARRAEASTEEALEPQHLQVIVVLPVLSLRGPRDRAIPEAMRARIEEAVIEAATSTTGVRVSPWRYARPIAAASVEPPSPEIARRLDSALSAALKFDTLKAVRLLNEVIAELESSGFVARNIDSLVQANLMLAKTYLGMGEMDLATAPMERALRLRPEASLDPRRFAPSVLLAHREVRDRVLAGDRGHLNLSPDISAQVLLDGRPVGRTPLSLDLVPGRHHLALRAHGHKPFESSLELIPGATRTLSPTLSRLPAFELADALLQLLTTPGGRADSLDVARRLAAVLEVDAVLVTGAQPVEEGFLLAMTLCAAPARSILGVFRAGQETLHLGPVLSKLLSGVIAGSADEEDPIRQVSVETDPVRVENVAARFADSLVGHSFASPKRDTRPVAAIPEALEVPESTPTPPRGTLGFWMGSAAAVVAAAVLTAVLYRPPPIEVQDADTLTLGVSRR